ncbi:MAG TPA: hypothetical protein VNJ05_04500 [Sphingomicrobium sp.]|nr:hypothetical protein [Sphingomicrobium sp.]
MQGKLAIAILVSAAAPSAAIAGEIVKRVTCPKMEQVQQRQQQAREQQRRAKSQGCPVQRQVPPVVDPTPHFFL